MSRFDPAAIELRDAHLLEASAGTGKTHALADIYLRLIAEKGHDVASVLALTFTNAAAGELKTRLREHIGEALRRASGRQDGLAAARLRRALSDFDRAPIGTIHGFCRRVIEEHNVECGVAGLMTVAPQEADVAEEAAREALRDRLAALQLAEPAMHRLCQWALARIGWEDVRRAVKLAMGLWVGRIEPGIDSDAEARGVAAVRRFDLAMEQVRTMWPRGSDELRRQLDEAGLDRRVYGPDRLDLMFEWMDDWLEHPGPLLDDGGLMEKWRSDSFRRRRRRDGRLPDHPLLHAIWDLAEAAVELDRESAFLAGAMLAGIVREALRRRRPMLDRLRVLGYEDLVEIVRRSVAGAGGAALARRLKAKYPAILVDEFQDTDPAQYEIFEALRQAGAAVFLIGDPKQSIYAFRGADVFTYHAAAANTQRHTLDRNWRSAPPLVRAVQTAFGRPNAFGLAFVGLPPVEPAESADPPRLVVGEEEPAPFRIQLIPPPSDGDTWSEGRARRLVAAAVAAEIADLLQPDSAVRLLECGQRRQVRPADIAVLVRTHREADCFRNALSEVGVPTVTAGDASVFASEDALYMFTVLTALARRRGEAVLRAAVLTPWFGTDPATIAPESSAEWDRVAARWSGYRDLWRGRGFRVMFEELLASEGVVERLLGRPDGDRRVTNLRHLADLLGDAEDAHRLGPVALAAWLAERIRHSDETNEETELRLDSDAARVQVLTIHQSKGLQYPIVFCPTLWSCPSRPHRGRPVVVCHESDEGGPRVLDLGGPELESRHRRAALEEFQEAVRLAYVAVTRARAACRVVWGPVVRAENSALAWLWHADGDERPGDAIRAVVKWKAQRIEDDLRRMAAAAEGAVAIEPLRTTPGRRLPAAPGICVGPAKVFSGPLDDGWRITSFTALKSGGRRAADIAAEEPGIDDGVVSAVVPLGADVAEKFRLPAGTATGLVVHELFKQVTFGTASVEAIEPLAAERLASHGLSVEWAGAIARTVADTLDTPLNPAGLRLRDVDPKKCAREQPFFLRMRMAAPELNRALGRGAATDARQGPSPLSFEPMWGHLCGFVDLWFEAGGRWYVADYKTNLLGDRPEDYGPERLAQVMAAADYELQARFYCVAIRRLFVARGRPAEETDATFGGVFYLFVRGMSPASGPAAGVHFFRPDPAELVRLSDALDGGGTT